MKKWYLTTIFNQPTIMYDGTISSITFEDIVEKLNRLDELEQKLNIAVVMQAEGSDGAQGAAVASEGQDTVAEGMGISTTFIDGDFNDSYEARIRRSKGRARLRPKGNRD